MADWSIIIKDKNNWVHLVNKQLTHHLVGSDSPSDYRQPYCPNLTPAVSTAAFKVRICHIVFVM